jgi:hypothetical protein
MPYDIPANIDIQKELKRLNPMKGFSDENTFQNYLMTLKEHIEPADSSPRTFVNELLKRFFRNLLRFSSSQFVDQHKHGEHIHVFHVCL